MSVVTRFSRVGLSIFSDFVFSGNSLEWRLQHLLLLPSIKMSKTFTFILQIELLLSHKCWAFSFVLDDKNDGCHQSEIKEKICYVCLGWKLCPHHFKSYGETLSVVKGFRGKLVELDMMSILEFRGNSNCQMWGFRCHTISHQQK